MPSTSQESLRSKVDASSCVIIVSSCCAEPHTGCLEATPPAITCMPCLPPTPLRHAGLPAWQVT